MNKRIVLAFFVASLVLLSACTAPKPTEPSESSHESIGVLSGGISATSKEGYRKIMTALYTHDSAWFHENTVTWDDVEFLGECEEFVFPNSSVYHYTLGHYGGNFELHCYHNGESWPDGEPTIEQFTPTSISEEMTDMMRIPSDEAEMRVISRNGFDYCYNKNGTLERIQWYIDDIRFKLVFKYNTLTAIPSEHLTSIHRLLSTDDDVAFAAMDEIIDKLSNRPPYVPKETTAESTPAQ